MTRKLNQTQGLVMVSCAKSRPSPSLFASSMGHPMNRPTLLLFTSITSVALWASGCCCGQSNPDDNLAERQRMYEEQEQAQHEGY